MNRQGPDLLHFNDRRGQHAQSWYASNLGEVPARPPLEGAEDCDVCIIGAGFTGLSAALHLAERGYRVIVLEAHLAGWGASGRNGGQVSSGQRLDQDHLEKEFGRETAHNLWDIAEEAKGLVRDLAERGGKQCHVADGIIHADHRERFVPESRAYADKLQRDYGYEQIRFLDKQEIRELIGSKAYFGGTLDEGAFHLDPLALAAGMAELAEKAGARIHEGSQVLSVERGKRPLARTADGEVRCNHLLIACNGYLGGLEPELARKVLPINNFVITTEPLGDELARSVLDTRAAVADSKFVVNYFRMTHDNRLLFGGGENYGYRFPADIKKFVQRPMLSIFPQLADTRIEHGWGGTLAITMKRLPLFARLAPNVLACTGYSGQGVALATMAGKLVGEAISGQAERFDLMGSLRIRDFPGGTRLRYPLLILAMTWYSLRDRF